MPTNGGRGERGAKGVKDEGRGWVVLDERTRC